MDFSKRNPLLSLDQRSGILPLDFKIGEETNSIELEKSTDLNRLLRKYQTIKKETGLHTLYLSWGEYEISNEELSRMPFYLIPTEIKLKKDSDKIEFQFDWESKIINPLLERILKEKYNLEAKKEAISSENACLGIFNYKKYILLDEIGQMNLESISNPIRELYDFNPQELDNLDRKPNLDSLMVLDADPSQREIIDMSLESKSFCVQGPPGTGKSQTITNIISANLKIGKKILFISEKKAAVDVVHDKLKKAGLGSILTQITDSSSDKKTFIKSLSKQWEEYKKKNTDESRIADYSSAYGKVERYLDHLFRFQPDLGMSLCDALKKWDYSASKLKKIDCPKMEVWNQVRDLMNFLYSEIENGRLQSDDLSAILSLNAVLLDSNDLEEKIQLHSKILKENLGKLKDRNIPFSSLQRMCIQSRVICGLQFKEKIEILRDSGKQKKYQSESKKYIKLKAELDNLLVDLKVWKEMPSDQTILFWEEHLDEKGWFNSNRKKARNTFESAIKNPVGDRKDLFEKTRKYLENQKKLNTCLSKLQSDFKISDPQREINELNLILSKSDYQKNLFEELLSRDFEELEYLDQLNPVLDKIQHSAKVLFGGIIEDQNQLENLAESIEKKLDFLIRNREQFINLKHIESKHLSFYADAKLTFEEKEKQVVQTNISSIIEKSAILSEIDEKELNLLLNEILKKRKLNYKINAKKIASQLISDFNELEELLITPAGRLQSAEKEEKKEVRTGKRILTHEFSKTRSFKAIREMCEMESKHWIFKMKKVWMMNPLSVSEILPFEKEQFDLLIIDEASQIPEEDIIPSLYRAKQVVIVGDKMQMPPSNFFSGNEVGPSILDTAHFRLKNEMLKWHYRSKNPELISFSNHAFYDSQLVVQPSLNPTDKNLHFHYVEKSNYSEGTNPYEAKALLDHSNANLNKLEGEIGIGCFSLAQQKTIEKLISKYPKLDSKLEDGSLFIRNLENLQGDECDHLFISIGYGPDKDGKLSLNFGPLSRNGGHNRLNVLITRARVSVNVFSSFQASDLRLSENEGINYLKEYLEYVQNPENQFDFKELEVDFEKKTAKISLKEPTEIESILTRMNVLKEVGFKVTL